MNYRGKTWTICNVSHGWSRGQKNEQRNNVAAGWQGPVKIQLFKGAGLLKELNRQAKMAIHSMSSAATINNLGGLWSKDKFWLTCASGLT